MCGDGLGFGNHTSGNGRCLLKPETNDFRSCESFEYGFFWDNVIGHCRRVKRCSKHGQSFYNFFNNMTECVQICAPQKGQARNALIPPEKEEPEIDADDIALADYFEILSEEDVITICKSLPESDLCTDRRSLRWSYDSATGRCREFFYGIHFELHVNCIMYKTSCILGGCGKSTNVFESLVGCQELCEIQMMNLN